MGCPVIQISVGRKYGRCKYIREILKKMPDIKYMILKCHAFTFMYKLYTYIYF